MPRELFRNEKKTSLWEKKVDELGSPNIIDEARANEILRRPRSEAYMEAIQQLDVVGQNSDPNILATLKEKIQTEFHEIPVFEIMLGIVAPCYLGKPYEVHTLDWVGSILEHFKQGEIMPGKLEMARSLAMHGSYKFVEVYTDSLRAVKPNGEVSVVGG